MFKKLGIVTNIWANEIANGRRFDDLMVEFGANGFRDMEVREGEYLRNSEFGKTLQKIENAIPEYTNNEFKTICNDMWDSGFDPNKTNYPMLFREIADFVEKAQD